MPTVAVGPVRSHCRPNTNSFCAAASVAPNARNAVVAAAKQVLKAERGSVWLYDAAADEMVMEVATGIAPVRIPASAGFVGSIGLSIRAERVDAAAARSMRESGIQHAGFYGELSLGKVDGFGSDTKLSVGDTTWFAGAEFEF